MRAQFHFQLSSFIFPILAKCNEDFWKKKNTNMEIRPRFYTVPQLSLPEYKTNRKILNLMLTPWDFLSQVTTTITSFGKHDHNGIWLD